MTDKAKPTMREQLSAAADALTKPVRFTLTTLGGAEVFIARMSPREIDAWWAWVFDKKSPAPKTESDKLVELFSRLCVDENGMRQYTDKAEVVAMREKKEWGAALVEFYSAACRQNFLYYSSLEEGLSRESFFSQKKLGQLTVENATLSKQLSDALQRLGEKPTGENSSTN